MRLTFLRDFGVFSEISEDPGRTRYTIVHVFNFVIAMNLLLLSPEDTVRCPLAHFLLSYRSHKARAIRSFNLQEDTC
jgi:hypothetical protein